VAWDKLFSKNRSFSATFRSFECSTINVVYLRRILFYKIMKNRLFLGFSLAALVAAFFINGCKSTATDPGYVALAEIRFADFHQNEPIKIYMYPVNATSADSMSKTPTPMTYGIVTPYFTNIPTNRTDGATYHLVAVEARGNTVEVDTVIVLKPNDKVTWVISGGSGVWDKRMIQDNHPNNQSTALAYYRFLNVSPNLTLDLRVGDPLNGMLLAGQVPYQAVSPYMGIPTAFDTSITFYVIDHNSGAVLGRLSGIGVDSGTYHTVTWGGQIDPTFRIRDNEGNTTLSDTIRIRILDDDQGTDLTVTVPQTFRYNIINALMPPNFPTATLIDYAQNGGLAIIINNNTVYDYNHIMPDSLAPRTFRLSPDGKIPYQIPTSIPYIPGTDKIYVKFVQPAGATPSPSDKILFRYYAGVTTGVGQIKSDQLYTMIVFDTVKKSDPKQADYIAPYDSAAGIATLAIPDVPQAGKAHVIVGEMLAGPNKPLAVTSNNKNVVFTVNEDGNIHPVPKVKKVKDYDTSIWVDAHKTITITAQIDTDQPYTSKPFEAEDGAIYEAFLVGQRGRPNDLDKYGPHFIIVRVNPTQP
jgi:hypothetical protein